ncbi:MAG TPA: hypothetical protein VHW00_09055 [Thermoanaerobaculia bacterium]|nr:hypothetical protein [Thermoanaerobaculia bacterium]
MHYRRLVLLFIAAVVSLRLQAECDKGSVKVPADESLTVAAYVEAGAPAADREWSSHDYAKFVEVLQGTVEKDAHQLPRFDSEKSGALMRRLVSETNFRVFQDTNLPMSTRLPEAAAFAQNLALLTGIYLQASNQGEPFDRELVELMGFIARVNDEIWTLADEFLASLPEEERGAKSGAIDTMRGGTAQVVIGAIQSFSEATTYRPAELRRFATLLAPSLPKLLPRLSAESSKEALIALRKMSSENCDDEVRALLGKLLESATGSVASAAETKQP